MTALSALLFSLGHQLLIAFQFTEIQKNDFCEW